MLSITTGHPEAARRVTLAIVLASLLALTAGMAVAEISEPVFEVSITGSSLFPRQWRTTSSGDHRLRIDFFAAQTASPGEREPAEKNFGLRLLGDLKRAVVVTAKDAGHVYTAPLRLDRESALWTGAALGLGVLIFAYDEEIFDAFQRNEDEAFYRPMRELGDAIDPIGHQGNTNAYYIGTLVLGYLFDLEELTRFSARILESHVVSGIGKNTANVVAGRRRPFEDEGAYSFEWQGGTSFPSGHSSNAWQLANVASASLDVLPLKILFYTGAVAISLQRISSGQHWPSDVYFAALFGHAVSETIIRRSEERRWRLEPVIGEQSGLIFRMPFDV